MRGTAGSAILGVLGEKARLLRANLWKKSGRHLKESKSAEGGRIGFVKPGRAVFVHTA